MDDNRVDLEKNKFDKVGFNNAIDSEFRELGVDEERDMSFFDPNLATLDDFFLIYENLFLEIPKEGEINSHEYLARTSGEHADYEKINEEINELIEEINELREENLRIYRENIDYQTRIQELEAFSVGDGQYRVRIVTSPINPPRVSPRFFIEFVGIGGDKQSFTPGDIVKIRSEYKGGDYTFEEWIIVNNKGDINIVEENPEYIEFKMPEYNITVIAKYTKI